MKLKFIYVCSPFRGKTPDERQHNIQMTERYCAEIIKENAIPVAPHLYFPHFLDDNNSRERAIGLTIGKILLNHCDELRVYGSEITEGMEAEIAFAKIQDIEINLTHYSGQD